MAAAVLTIDINARLTSLEKGLTDASNRFDKLSRNIATSSKAMSAAMSFLTHSIQSVAGALGVGLGIHAAIREFEAIKEATIDAERSINQMNAVLVATRSAAGLSAGRLDELAQAVRKASVFNDDDIRKAETALLRFRGIQSDVFEDTLKLAPDVSAVLGVDLPAAAVALGRALSDPATGMRTLRTAGVHLSEQQIDLIARMKEMGDTAGAQRLALDEITKSVGGASGADNSGLFGATKRLARAWDDLEKAVGKKIFSGDNALTKGVTERFQSLAENINKSDVNFDEWIKKVKTLADKLDPLIKVFSGGLVSFVSKADTEQPARRSVSGPITNLVTGKTLQEEAEAEAAMRGLISAKVEAEQERLEHINKAALQKRAQNAATFNADALSIQKRAIDLEQQLLEQGYARGTIATEDFYAGLEKLAQASFLSRSIDLGKQAKAFEDLKNSGKFSRDEEESARIRIIALAVQSGDLVAEKDRKLIEIANQRALTVEHLADEYAQLAIQVKEASGDIVGAAVDSFNLAHKNQLKRFTIDSNKGNFDATVAAGNIATLGERNGQQAKLNESQTKYLQLLEEVGNKVERINLARDSGAITELQALSQISSANKERLGALQKEIDVMTDLAKLWANTPKGTELLAGIDALRLRMERLSVQTDLVADKFRKVFSDSFTDAFADVIDGTKSLSDAFRSMERSILSSINRIAAQNIAESLFGKSGFLGSGGSFDIGSIFKKLFGFAGGTDFAPGGLSIVGERGPEIMNVPRGAQIIPNEILRAARGSRALTQIFNITVPESMSRKTSSQIARELGNRMISAQRDA